MRWLLAASFLTACSVVPACARARSHARRKTIGFGPDLPHAVYRTDITQYTAGFGSSSNSPFEIAADFLRWVTSDTLNHATSFYIRQDSYTDRNTATSHIYVRQLIYGIEIANGDININIKDGVVLSYGDSFYRGNGTEAVDVDVHSQYCAQLAQKLTAQQMDSDCVYNSPADWAEQAVLSSARSRSRFSQLLEWNCGSLADAYQTIPEAHLNADGPHYDPRPALLRFMAAAIPDDLLSKAIYQMPQVFIDRMTVSMHEESDPVIRTLRVVNNVLETRSPVKADIAYMQVPYGDSVALQRVWKFIVEMQDNWYEATVTVEAPHRIVSVVDWVADSPVLSVPVPKNSGHHALYRVYSWGINDPDEGDRTLEKASPDSLASPIGWHGVHVVDGLCKGGNHVELECATEFENTTTTQGNNVFAQENWAGSSEWRSRYSPNAGPELEFDYNYDPNPIEPNGPADTAKKYINASITQLFYTVNKIHDLYYRYGFDEASGNFQQYNFGKGGKEDDAVVIDAQSGAGMNNADFATPPDGEKPRCRMYLWSTVKPYRDGAFDSGIVIHELSHGLSIRLTGGPANSACLPYGEAGGMGEGWGDFFATLIRSNERYSDYPLGAWVFNRPGGGRKYPFSMDPEINPTTYKTLDGYWGIHDIGAVWCEILWIVTQRLIAKYGFAATLFPPAPLADGTVPEGDFYRLAEHAWTGGRRPLVPRHGNSLMLQLVINAMKLQPCLPSFFNARDSIITADHILTGGENYCDLWIGFAVRGLGPDARAAGRTPWGGGIRTNDFSVPIVCQEGL